MLCLEFFCWLLKIRHKLPLSVECWGKKFPIKVDIERFVVKRCFLKRIGRIISNFFIVVKVLAYVLRKLFKFSATDLTYIQKDLEKRQK
eukprot:TRINITY_DN885_c0_g1_i1.p1 TRINITY_DN885_c0_g1~~TRINITY_DN885_c0_g1_i1.p1  ORF type:complete len:89 (+),score=4.02 TRINITY_DN885_c0_g1_i1:69-335(+)